MTESQLYRAAADVLRRDGWCKGMYTNQSGKHCLYGAIYAACGSMYCPTPVLRSVVDGDITAFNDHYCQSVDDALAALEIAADLATKP